MIEPPLDEAIGALREEESLAPGDALGTRSRVLATLGRRRQQRQAWLVAGMVLACCLVGTTSWAWVTGWLPARLGLETQPAELISSGRARPPAGARQAGAMDRAPEPVVEPVAEPEVPSAPTIEMAASSAAAIERAAPPSTPAAPSTQAIEMPPPSPPTIAPARTPAQPKAPARSLSRPSPPATTPVVASSPRTVAPDAPAAHDVSAGDAPAAAAPVEPVAAAPPPDPELAAFRRAHEAHFGGGEPLAVLALWDDYLARFAAGRLSPEARWNRAVLLVRLGRASEARAALAPFAAGAEGGYRQRDAEELLRTLP